MDTLEKIIEIPACFITEEIANKIATKIYQIAKELQHVEYEQALRQIAPSIQLTPDDAVLQFINNHEFQKQIAPRKDKTIFISKQKNIEYNGRDVSYKEIPVDTNQIIINAAGENKKLINITTTNDLVKFFPLSDFNKILIQGSDEAWVNSIYYELSSYISDSKKIFRDFVYKYFRFFSFLLFSCLSFLELKIFSFIKPSFTFYTPLTGLSSVIIFMIFIINYNITYLYGAKIIEHLYPYMELENRLNQKRKDLKWIINLSVGAIFCGGLWSLISMLI